MVEDVKRDTLSDNIMEPVNKKGRFPTFLDLFVMVCFVLVAQVLVTTICGLFGLPMPELPGGDIVDIEQFIGVQVTRGNSFAIIYPLSMLFAFVAIYFYIRFRDGKGRIARTSLGGFNPNVVLGGLVWLISVQVVVEPISALLPVANQSAGQGLWAVVTAVLFAPIFEELIFRGLILEAMLRHHRRLFSVVITSLLFAVVHLQPSVMFSAFVSGLVLGTIYLHTNSIFATVLLHSINNAIAFSIIALNVENYSYRQVLGDGAIYHIVYAVCLVICVIATVETWRRRR